MVGKYRLEVSYTGARDLDDQLRKIVGKDDWASGAGFDGRDLSFDFRSEKECKRAEQRLAKAAIERLTVSTWVDDSADPPEPAGLADEMVKELAEVMRCFDRDNVMERQDRKPRTPGVLVTITIRQAVRIRELLTECGVPAKEPK
jgi:hypothetical protein